MGKIDDLKNILNQKVSDGKYRMSCYIEDINMQANDGLMLFYNDENTTLALGRFTQDGYFSLGVQVVSRHTDYDKARKVALAAYKYINVHSKDTGQAGYFIPERIPPNYLGRDERNQAYMWGFNVNIKGGDS